jgi:hypothetical protein
MSDLIHYHNFLRQITGEEKLEDSLFRIVTEYLNLKINFLAQKKQEFETKYAMSFEQYEAYSLDKAHHLWEEEQIVIEWSKTLILLVSHQKLMKKWMEINSKIV